MYKHLVCDALFCTTQAQAARNRGAVQHESGHSGREESRENDALAQAARP